MSGNVTKDISTFDEMIHVHPRSSSTASHPTATRRRTPLTRIAGICMRVSFARRRQTMAPHPHATRTLPTRHRAREKLRQRFHEPQGYADEDCAAHAATTSSTSLNTFSVVVVARPYGMSFALPLETPSRNEVIVLAGNGRPRTPRTPRQQGYSQGAG